MSNEEKKINIVPQNDEFAMEDFAMEDFAITELEERLEFLAKCNTNCKCPTQP